MKDKFPTLELIDNKTIREETTRVLREHTPDYFYTAPATSSDKYHNKYARGKHGLWIHTLMVCTAFERPARAWKAQGRVSDIEVDAGRAACLLHDLRKYGNEYVEGHGADKDHDSQMYRLIKHETSLPKSVSDAIHSHMGANSWGYDGPEPTTELGDLVHIADLAGSNHNATYAIYNKPDTIETMFPEIPNAEFF